MSSLAAPQPRAGVLVLSAASSSTTTGAPADAAAAQHSVCWHAALDGGVSVRGGIDFICCDPERLHSALTDTVTAHDTAEAGIGQSDSEMSEADAHIIQRVAPIASDGGEAHDAAADEDDVDDDAPLLKGDESPAATLKNAFDLSLIHI